jgi:hypothetical protein
MLQHGLPLEPSFPKLKSAIVLGTIVIVNIVVWIAAGITFTDLMPGNIALLVVAYTLGLRHALDADHIAAIDNVTRYCNEIIETLNPNPNPKDRENDYNQGIDQKLNKDIKNKE